MHHSSSYHFDDDDNSAAAAPPIQTTVIVPSTRSAHVFIRHPTSLLCPPRATLPTYSPAPRPPLPSSFSARQVQASRSNANSWPPLMCRCAAYGASAYDLKANSSYANSTGRCQPPDLPFPFHLSSHNVAEASIVASAGLKLFRRDIVFSEPTSFLRRCSCCAHDQWGRGRRHWRDMPVQVGVKCMRRVKVYWSMTRQQSTDSRGGATPQRLWMRGR